MLYEYLYNIYTLVEGIKTVMLNMKSTREIIFRRKIPCDMISKSSNIYYIERVNNFWVVPIQQFIGVESTTVVIILNLNSPTFADQWFNGSCWKEGTWKLHPKLNGCVWFFWGGLFPIFFVYMQIVLVSNPITYPWYCHGKFYTPITLLDNPAIVFYISVMFP